MRPVPLRRAAASLALGLLAPVLPGAAPATAEAAVAAVENPITVQVSSDLRCRVDVLDWHLTAFAGSNLCGTLLAVGGTPATSRLFGPPVFGYWGGEGPGPREGWSYRSDPTAPVTSVLGDEDEPGYEVLAGDTGVSLTQVDSYVPGEERYRTDITVTAGTTAAQGVLYRVGQCAFEYGAPYPNSVMFEYPATRADTTTTYPSAMCTESSKPDPPHVQWTPLTGPANYAAGTVDDVWTPVSAREPFADTCGCAATERTAAGISWSWSLAAGESVTFSHLTDFGGYRDLVGVGTASPESVQPGGETVTYTVGIRNPNFQPVVLSTILNVLPLHFTYQAGSTIGAPEPTLTGRTLSFPGPWTVAARSTAWVTFRAITGAATATNWVTGVGGTAVGVDVRTEWTAKVAVLWRTTLEAEPIVADRGGGAGDVAFRARLTVTDTGAPVPNEDVLVWSATGIVCIALTDADGWATCGPGAGAGPFRAVYQRRTEHWRGEPAVYEASSDVFPLAVVAGNEVMHPEVPVP
ncbi:MAG TPA: hypothetical protein VNA20_16760 [Frankiaceae bacterium]|nr:hypothetical protein [Frankiaceae bacterium]